MFAAAVLLAGSCIEDPQFKPADVAVNPTEVSFDKESGEKIIKLKSNRDWVAEITPSRGDADWLVLSEMSGKASEDSVEISISVLQNTGEDRDAVVKFNTGTVYASVNVSQLGETRKSYTKISEFLAAPVDGKTWYEIQGKVIEIKNTTYGNVTMQDETGSVYIHGITATRQNTNDKSFSSLGISVGDILVIKTLRNDFNGTPQGGGDIPAYYISHEKGEGGGGDNPDIGENWKKPAVTAFGDDFQSIKTSYIKYVTDNWTFWSSDISDIKTQFKTNIFNNTEKYIDIAPYSSAQASVTAFAMLPKANVSGASPKALEFETALYYLDNQDDSRFEVVVSEDFNGSFTDATWTVVYDATYPQGADKNQWMKHTADLSAYSSSQALYIAFRYTGKSNTYRLDNVKFGTPDNMNGGNEGDGENPGGGESEGTEGDGIFTSNVGLPTEDSKDNASYTGIVITGGSEYPCLKLGTSSKAGTYTTPALTATGSKLSFYAVAWNGKTCDLTVTINGGGKINGAASATVTLRPNSGASNNSPYTIEFGKDFYTFDLSGVTNSTTITFSTADGGPRCVITGVNVR